MEHLNQHHLTRLFEENGYKLVEQNGQYTVRKKNSSFMILTTLSIAIGVLLLYMSTHFAMNYKIILAGVLFMGMPFIYERWKYPNRIVIDSSEKCIYLKSGLAFVRVVPFSEISSLEVDESVVNSDVSPFKEGYQDFIYDFRLKVGQTKLKLFNLMYRKANDSEIQEVVRILSEKLQLTKTVKLPISYRL